MLAAAVDAAPIPALVVSLEGEIAFVNTALLGVTGHTPAELVGCRSSVLIPPGAANAFEAARSGLERGQRWRGEVAFQRKDGTIFQHDLSLAPVSGGGGAVTHAVGMCLDLTERRSQERLLLTDRMVSVGTLAAGVAHEINNPLSFVLTNLTFLADTIQELQAGATPEPELRQALREVGEAVGEVRVGAERVRDIVRDLKSFSRGDDGERRQVDVQQVLESSIKMTWNEIRHRARLVREYGTDVPPVEAEEARLGQVFLNLILNAVQAIPEGDAKANEIRVSTRAEAGRVVVEVRDTGGGIPASVRPRLFEPFFTTKPVGVGTGLGLYISREIVTGLGGTIAVESTVGAGTVFRVVLPAQGAPPVARQAPAPPVTLIARGRVLVVDDDPLIGLTIARLLARHEVILANAGREALGRLQRGERFDLVLCDLMMPDMSGMELYAEVERAWPDVAAAMVFLTGGVFTPEAAAFVERVRNTIVEKPFDPEQLRALVARRLAERMRR